MKRVLCLVSCMNAGGAETFLMKIYRRLDKTKYQMDFCVNEEKPGFYDSEIKSMGGKIYYVPQKSKNVKDFAKGLSKIVKENGYKNVMRVTSNALGFYDLYIAKKAGAQNTVARSSNSSDGGGIKPWLAHRLGKIFYKKYVDVKIAPSDLAAIYTFGKKDYKNGRVHILKNGIDKDIYAFSTDKRNAVRKELGVKDDQILLGHIGRFTKQKNHTFLIDVFCEVQKTHENATLLLVGEGELNAAVREKIKERGLENNVIITGIRKDIPAVLSAMDLFLFPSLYEGMPNVIIEAQAASLNCLISNTITKQVVFSPLVKQLPISDKKLWVENADSLINALEKERTKTLENRKNQSLPKEYDIGEVCEEFVSYLI